jgi:MFS family permease
MLASITPLGERSRGFSWRVTAGWFALGAVGAGTLGGALLGALGGLLPAGLEWRTVAAAVVLTAALLLDATPLRHSLPSSRRQVNEDWLGRYRGWVYGLGFGAQLGVGVVTIVGSAAIYAAALLALLAPGAAAGAAIGSVFGAVRALSLLPARAAGDPVGLAALHRRVAALEDPVRRGTLALEALAVVVLLGALA